MIELSDWFQRKPFAPKPWLVVGAGPTFDRRGDFDLDEYNVLTLDGVVSALRGDVAHIVDLDVVADCADRLAAQSDWLLMPRYPQVAGRPGARPLEDWFDRHPVLREIDGRGRLVWYNLAGTPRVDQSPTIGAAPFPSEMALNILARMGVTTVRSLGIDDGGTEEHERLAVAIEEHDLDHRSLVEPLRIFIGGDEQQLAACRVLEYSIRKHASVPVEIHPMLDLPHPMPRDERNRPRTRFSYYRFMIPELCGHRGRALYLDADMLVFGDVAELRDMPFDGRRVLCTAPAPTEMWKGYDSPYLGARSVAVMLLDCEELDWEIDEIVRGLDEHRYTYEQLLSDICILEPDQVADTIPPEWNDLERYSPEHTKLLHFTVTHTQPWRNDKNPRCDLWMSWYREAVEAGVVVPEEVEALIARGLVKPELRNALRLSPSRRAVLTSASRDLVTARDRVATLEAQKSAMRRSSSWRIGSRIVRTLGAPKRAFAKLRRR